MKLSAPTPGAVASRLRGRPAPRPRHCRACLAAEVVTETRPGRVVSSLGKAGYCADRAACERRQPPLFDA